MSGEKLRVEHFCENSRVTMSKTFRETDASLLVLCVNKIEEQYGRSISVSRLLQKSGGSSDVDRACRSAVQEVLR